MKLDNAYITSDLHIGSNNIAKTRGYNTWEDAWNNYKFNHNSLIKNKNDIVIIAGDICSNKKYQHYLTELTGSLHFVIGNHDLEFDYNKYGQTYPMLICNKLKLIITHIPIHTCFFYGKKESYFNIHGHLHDMKVITEDKFIDKRYINVSPDLNKNSPILLLDLINKN